MSKSKINLGKLKGTKDVPASKHAKLTFPESSYYPDILQTAYSEKELRDEYTRLRDIAQKRIKRLAAKFPDSATYQKWKDGVPKLRDLKTESDVAYGLSELASFVGSKASTLTGQKTIRSQAQDTIDKINRHYGLNLTQGNAFDRYTRVMNAQVANNIEKIFNSNRAVALFKVLEKKGIKGRALNAFISTPSKMAYWLDQVENLDAVELAKGKGKSAKNYKELIESEIAHGYDRRPVKIPDAEDIISGKRDPRKERRGNNRHTRTARRSRRDSK